MDQIVIGFPLFYSDILEEASERDSACPNGHELESAYHVYCPQCGVCIAKTVAKPALRILCDILGETFDENWDFDDFCLEDLRDLDGMFTTYGSGGDSHIVCGFGAEDALTLEEIHQKVAEAQTLRQKLGPTFNERPIKIWIGEG